MRGSNVFDFEIANSGTTLISHHDPSLSGFTGKKTNEASYMDGKTYKNLYADSAFRITRIDDSRVQGTFSGIFSAEKAMVARQQPLRTATLICLFEELALMVACTANELNDVNPIVKMKSIHLSAALLFTIMVLTSSCNHSAGKTGENEAVKSSAEDSGTPVVKPTSPITTPGSDSPGGTAIKDAGTSSTPTKSDPADSDFLPLKGLSSLVGKSDSGILNNPGGGNSADNMTTKLQSMLAGKGGDPGGSISSSVLQFQLGQMNDNNPLKSVAKGMMESQKNGTAGPDKTYTAVYTPEQPANYKIPVSGTGNTIVLQYSGGSVAGNKKDGLWKNISVSTHTANPWNVYTEAYTESSAIHVKVHANSLANVSQPYSINLNEQYKKYARQPKSDLGKNESDVHVQKIGDEDLFGYHCMHVKIAYTLKALGQTTNMQDDEWYSVGVPGAQFLSPLIFENHAPAVVRQIISTGCSGVLVKSVIVSSGSSQLIQLSSILQKDLPDSLFRLPASFQEDKNTALYDIR